MLMGDGHTCGVVSASCAGMLAGATPGRARSALVSHASARNRADRYINENPQSRQSFCMYRCVCFLPSPELLNPK
jgi:hypothetical protein